MVGLHLNKNVLIYMLFEVVAPTGRAIIYKEAKTNLSTSCARIPRYKIPERPDSGTRT